MGPRRIGTAIVAMVCLLPGVAHGQQLMAEYIGAGQPIFNEEDVGTLARVYGLTPEQRTAVDALLREAMAKAYKRSMRVWESTPWDGQAISRQPLEDPDEEAAFQEKQMSDWYRRSVEAGRECARMERDALADVESILTKEQRARGWTEFDRQRRRAVVHLGAYWFGCDPAATLRKLEAGEADQKAAAPILERLEERMDGLIVRRMAAIASMNERALAGKKIEDDAWMRPEMMHKEIRALNVRTFRDISEVVSEGLADAIARQRAGTELWAFQPLDRDGQFVSITTLVSLTQEQRSAMDALIDADRRSLVEFVQETLRLQDSLVLAGEEATAIQIKVQERLPKFEDLKARLVKELKEVLTVEQRLGLAAVSAQQDYDQMFNQKRSMLPDSPWRVMPRRAGASK